MRLSPGDIHLEFSLAGEPSRTFLLWRSTLNGLSPSSASVALLKARPGWTRSDRAFYFHSVTKTERKLADMDLAARSDKLTGTENANAARLHDVLWRWLKDGEAPRLEGAMPRSEVHIQFECSAKAALEQLEHLTDVMGVGASRFHLAFGRLGTPPTVEQRSPKGMDTPGDRQELVQEVETFRAAMEPEQFETFEDLSNRLARVYQKRSGQRRDNIQKRAREMLGEGANAWLTARQTFRPAPIHSVSNTGAFEDYMAFLNWRAAGSPN